MTKLTKEFWKEFEETGTKIIINEDGTSEIIKEEKDEQTSNVISKK